ncbi:MAG: choline dehydrogenase-like flavoprotein [Chlamydiales bacterium]|jgi:choline dehydrogenase-like flavoprotein
MIVDLNESRSGTLPLYDLCIIGSGPAGATLAAELADAERSICVLESGLGNSTRHADSLRDVASEGIHIKEYSRERVLGGASTTWAGLSSPLDRTDLEPRPWLPHSGWPITEAELTPYYAQAAERYRFPPATLFGTDGFGALRDREGLRADRQPASWEAVHEKIFLACSDPQNFGREQRAIYGGTAIDLYLDATVLRLEPGSGTKSIDCARVRTRDGHEHTLRARVFVLATGGIENARLLLNSTDLCPQGLGNERDQVGRFFMNHPKNYHGILHLAQPRGDVPYYFGCLYKGYAGYAGLCLKPEVQADAQLLNSYVRLEPLFPWSDSQGVEALVLIVKRCSFFFKRWKDKRKDEVVTLRDYSETGDDSDLQNQRKSVGKWIGLLFTILFDIRKVGTYALYRLSRKKPKIRRVRLRNFMEMEPVPQNRVTLTTERDPYGTPIACVRHECTPADERSMKALHEHLAREFEAQGIGRLETSLQDVKPWPITQDASHHMGSTRMGSDPSSSVVTPQGRLHTVDNVFAAGASVFPTSGSANPTFTIVALSIRLAEHLKRDVLPNLPNRPDARDNAAAPGQA